MDRFYRLSVRAALVMSAMLALIATATSVALGVPQLVVWNLPAAAIALYARQRMEATREAVTAGRETVTA